MVHFDNGTIYVVVHGLMRNLGTVILSKEVVASKNIVNIPVLNTRKILYLDIEMLS